MRRGSTSCRTASPLTVSETGFIPGVPDEERNDHLRHGSRALPVASDRVECIVTDVVPRPEAGAHRRARVLARLREVGVLSVADLARELGRLAHDGAP